MFTYLLSYDPFASDPSPQKLCEFVRSNALTYQFLIPFSGTIFIKSENTLRELMVSYHPFIAPNPFTITVITPTLISGMIPVDYWHWINNQHPEPIRNLL